MLGGSKHRGEERVEQCRPQQHQEAQALFHLGEESVARPKRERVSIFSQPANSSFFQSANQLSSTDDVDDVVVMPSLQEELRSPERGDLPVLEVFEPVEATRRVSEKSEAL